VPKVRYLVAENSGYKLPRNIPNHLRKFADSTAFVERIPKNINSASEIEQRRNLFAVKTDAELNKLKREFELSSFDTDPANFDFEITSEIELSQLAQVYFSTQLVDDKRFYNENYPVSQSQKRKMLMKAGLDYNELLMDTESDRLSCVCLALELLADARIIPPGKIKTQIKLWSNFKGQRHVQLLDAIVRKEQALFCRTA